MAVSAASPGSGQPTEQVLYARLLDAGTRIGLAVLVAAFVAYAFGLVTPHVPLERLPEVWALPVSQFLEATGLPAGWQWVRFAHRGDVANLVGIAVLAGCSLLALIALVGLYLRRGERLYAAICAAEIAVVVLAASGVLTAGH